MATSSRRYRFRLVFCTLLGAAVLCQLGVGLYLHMRSRPRRPDYEYCGCRNFQLTAATLFEEDCADDYCRTTCRRGFPWPIYRCNQPQRQLWDEVYAVQRPGNCSAAPTLLDVGALPGDNSFASAIHHWGHRLLQSLNANRTLLADVAPRWHTQPSPACPEGDVRCIIEPLSLCPMPVGERIGAAGTGGLANLNLTVVSFDAATPLMSGRDGPQLRDDGPPRLRGLSADVTARLGVRRWAYSHLVAYVLRPTMALKEAIVKRIAETSFRDQDEFTVALLVPGGFVTGNKRRYPLLEFAKTALEYLDRRPDFKSRRIKLAAFVVTDDESVVKELGIYKTMFRRWIFSNPTDITVQNVQMVADVFLAATADWIIGTQSSELHQLIFELATAWHPKRHASDIGCLFQEDGGTLNCLPYIKP